MASNTAAAAAAAAAAEFSAPGAEARVLDLVSKICSAAKKGDWPGQWEATHKLMTLCTNLEEGEKFRVPLGNYVPAPLMPSLLAGLDQGGKGEEELLATLGRLQLMGLLLSDGFLSHKVLTEAPDLLSRELLPQIANLIYERSNQGDYREICAFGLWVTRMCARNADLLAVLTANSSAKTLGSMLAVAMSSKSSVIRMEALNTLQALLPAPDNALMRALGNGTLTRCWGHALLKECCLDLQSSRVRDRSLEVAVRVLPLLKQSADLRKWVAESLRKDGEFCRVFDSLLASRTAAPDSTVQTSSPERIRSATLLWGVFCSLQPEGFFYSKNMKTKDWEDIKGRIKRATSNFEHTDEAVQLAEVEAWTSFCEHVLVEGAKSPGKLPVPLMLSIWHHSLRLIDSESVKRSWLHQLRRLVYAVGKRGPEYLLALCWQSENSQPTVKRKDLFALLQSVASAGSSSSSDSRDAHRSTTAGDRKGKKRKQRGECTEVERSVAAACGHHSNKIWRQEALSLLSNVLGAGEVATVQEDGAKNHPYVHIDGIREELADQFLVQVFELLVCVPDQFWGSEAADHERWAHQCWRESWIAALTLYANALGGECRAASSLVSCLSYLMLSKRPGGASASAVCKVELLECIRSGGDTLGTILAAVLDSQAKSLKGLGDRESTLLCMARACCPDAQRLTAKHVLSALEMEILLCEADLSGDEDLQGVFRCWIEDMKGGGLPAWNYIATSLWQDLLQRGAGASFDGTRSSRKKSTSSSLSPAVMCSLLTLPFRLHPVTPKDKFLAIERRIWLNLFTCLFSKSDGQWWQVQSEDDYLMLADALEKLEYFLQGAFGQEHELHQALEAAVKACSVSHHLACAGCQVVLKALKYTEAQGEKGDWTVLESTLFLFLDGVHDFMKAAAAESSARQALAFALSELFCAVAALEDRERYRIKLLRVCKALSAKLSQKYDPLFSDEWKILLRDLARMYEHVDEPPPPVDCSSLRLVAVPGAAVVVGASFCGMKDKSPSAVAGAGAGAEAGAGAAAQAGPEAAAGSAALTSPCTAKKVPATTGAYIRVFSTPASVPKRKKKMRRASNVGCTTYTSADGSQALDWDPLQDESQSQSQGRI